MATPFFGKRESESQNNRSAGPTSQSLGAHPLGGLSGNGASLTAKQPTGQTTAAPTGAAPATVPAQGTSREGGSKLTVGPNIKLKGVEITDCDTLVVEGLVEATMDSRLMQIADIGSFRGSAEIDIAEIHGAFDGDLTVRDRLVIYATGKVTGNIRYGKVVIEEGGQLSGNITFGASSTGSTGSTGRTDGGKASLHVAAA